MKPPFKMIISNEIEQWRNDTFWDKEPETIEWIKSFKDGDIFFDVGANIGIYSLYCAAVHPKCRIFAFEPSPGNFKHLEKNIELNEYKTLFAAPFIVAERDYKKGFSSLLKKIGSSGGQMNDKGGTPSITIDKFHPTPNHIKIDIDGQEWKVMQGMTETLKNKNLKSVLIEINENKIEIFKAFYDAGFTSDNRFNFLENHSRVRRAKEGIKAENIIFTRREK